MVVRKLLMLKKRIIRRICDCKDISIWDNFGCAKALGEGVLQITKNNAALSYMNCWIRPTYNFKNYNKLKVMFYIDDITDFATLGITLHLAGGDEVNLSAIWVGGLSTGWNKVVVKKVDFAAFGLGTWESVAEIRFTVNFSKNDIVRVAKFKNVWVMR